MKDLHQQQQQRPPPMWQAFGNSLWWRHFCDKAATRFYAPAAPAVARAATPTAARAETTAATAEAAAAEAAISAAGPAVCSSTRSNGSDNDVGGGDATQQEAENSCRGTEKERGAAAVNFDGGLPQHCWPLDHIFPKNNPFRLLQQQQQQPDSEQAEERMKQERGEASKREELTPAENGSCCRRVAVFDLDGTIITTKSGKKFPVDSDDWRLMYTPQTQKKLKELHDVGYHLVIVSNQLGVEKGHTTLLTLTRKCESLQKLLGLPVTICLAVADDLLRKPRPAAAVFIFDCLLPYLHQCCCCTPPGVAALSLCRYSSTASSGSGRIWQHHGEQQLQQPSAAPPQLSLPLSATALPVTFFVGDAAGRRGIETAAGNNSSRLTAAGARQSGRGTWRNKGKQGRAAAVIDHGDADVKFALNIGLPFFTPEQFFLGIEGEVPPLLQAHRALCVALPAAESAASAASGAATAHLPAATSVGSNTTPAGHQATPSEEEACDRFSKKVSSADALKENKSFTQQKLSFSVQNDVLRCSSPASTARSAGMFRAQLPSKLGTRAAFDPRDLLPVIWDKDLLAKRKRVLLQKLRGTKGATISSSVELHGDGAPPAPLTGAVVSPKEKHLRLFPTNDAATTRQDSAEFASDSPTSGAACISLLAGAAEHSFSRCAKSGSDVSCEKEGLVDIAERAEEQEVVLLVGAPGSGKSTMVCTFFKDYVSVCQDELRVQQRCTRACEVALRAGKSVIIDMQNTRRETRSKYIALAKQMGVKKVRCVVLLWPKDFCKHTIVYRSLVAQYRRYRSQLELKSRKAEGGDKQREDQETGGKGKRTLVKAVGENDQNYFASNTESVRFRLERVPSLVVDKFYKDLEQPSAGDEGLTDTVVLDDLNEYFVPAPFANDEEQQLFFSFLQ